MQALADLLIEEIADTNRTFIQGTAGNKITPAKPRNILAGTTDPTTIDILAFCSAPVPTPSIYLRQRHRTCHGTPTKQGAEVKRPLEPAIRDDQVLIDLLYALDEVACFFELK